MAQPARFTFDLDLGKRTKPSAPPEPTMPERLVAELLAQARQEAYAEGLAAGERNATAMAAQTLAASIGRKLALHLLARYPTVELDALIAECMQSLNGVPHLVVRCHPYIADGIRDIATAHMHTSGFAGRLVVMGDPEQRLGDGRLEWVDGGLVRDIGAIAKDIDRKISAYLTARSGQTRHEESDQ